MSDSSSSGLHGPAVRSERQHTLGASFSLEGIGLHTGEMTQLTVHPADPDHGYVFQRMDLDEAPRVPADCDLVVETRRGTTLEKDGARVHTTEHLLAALHGCGIDNALIEMDGPEVPILDGSSWPFVAHIEEVGTVEQEADRHFITLTEPITHRSEDGVEMLAVPPVQDEFRLTVMVDYGSPVLGTQHASMRHLGHTSPTSAAAGRLSSSRRSRRCSSRDSSRADLDNAIVLAERTYSEEEIASIASLAGKEGLAVDPGKTGVLNNTTLQHANEPARHKLLDIIGDLA